MTVVLTILGVIALIIVISILGWILKGLRYIFRLIFGFVGEGVGSCLLAIGELIVGIAVVVAVLELLMTAL